jgi:hypothetical protein
MGHVKRTVAPSIVIALLMGYFGAVACGPSAEPPACDPARSSCEPALSGCVDRGGADDERSCAEICEGLGGGCVARGCDGQTFMKFLGCVDDDHDGGSVSAQDCEEPIEWQASDAVQCCCVGVEP